MLHFKWPKTYILFLPRATLLCNSFISLLVYFVYQNGILEQSAWAEIEVKNCLQTFKINFREKQVPFWRSHQRKFLGEM